MERVEVTIGNCVAYLYSDLHHSGNVRSPVWDIQIRIIGRLREATTKPTMPPPKKIPLWKQPFLYLRRLRVKKTENWPI